MRDRGLEGCWACPELESCTVGFFGIDDAEAVNLAKAGALFVRKYGANSYVAALNYIFTEKKMCYNDYFTDKSSVQVILDGMIKAWMG